MGAISPRRIPHFPLIDAPLHINFEDFVFLTHNREIGWNYI